MLFTLLCAAAYVICVHALSSLRFYDSFPSEIVSLKDSIIEHGTITSARQLMDRFQGFCPTTAVYREFVWDRTTSGSLANSIKTLKNYGEEAFIHFAEECK
ncbi:hypothetical protein BCR37DRAFT_389363 [Protomyces lactucae-debilis]|uniref:Uncharacterized protein n=1 Tax=Protomyces lactucae-debilis TaxID=2754530 RepID=A0A1Y2F114_PROLT|nr:uncharacterized protein BCR37DRAFT_389363 [Protomyces lactucae-debilis]ORY76655.1 hypothetical protein BCR37DRAFT_389363 [Protomyces lactucae-debilis]